MAVCLGALSLQPMSAAQGVPFEDIKVSKNHRYLTHQDRKPFFYLGDTAWELFHRLDREEAKRLEKGIFRRP